MGASRKDPSAVMPDAGAVVRSVLRSCAVTRVRTARIRTESPEAKRAGDALLRGTTPLAQDTPAEQDRIRELGLVVADVHGDLHGLDDALGCRLDCPNLVLLRVEEEPNDLRLSGGCRLRDGFPRITSRVETARGGLAFCRTPMSRACRWCRALDPWSVARLKHLTGSRSCTRHVRAWRRDSDHQADVSGSDKDRGRTTGRACRVSGRGRGPS